MINKIEKIISIGKYRNYQASGPVNFKKLTLIYGDNGGGKTTLSSIFRSVSNNDPEIIRNRISTNHSDPQSAQISEVGSPNIFHTFGTSGWSIPFSDIEVFDIHFINENIYSGFDFNDEQRKQLHNFVIGAQGVAVQNQIEQNKAAKTNSRQVQTSLKSELIQQVGNNLTDDLINRFLNIPPSQKNDIDQQISNAEAALASANANAFIQSFQTLSKITDEISRLDLNPITSDLQITSKTIQNAALEALYNQHCEELTNNNLDGSENWLQKGYSYVKKKQANNELNQLCPFCRQSLDFNSDIINAYTSKFDTAFNDLIRRLNEYKEKLQSFNIEAKIQSIINIHTLNLSLIETWSLHLPETVQIPEFSFIEDEENLKSEFQTAIDLVQSKIQNPTVAIDISTIDDIREKFQIISSKINEYNQTVIKYNSEISTFRSSIKSVQNAQSELDSLKRIKKRFEVPINTLCDQLSTERQKLRDLETIYTQLSQQQEQAASTFFSNYQIRINHYLENVFRTPFKIEDVNHIAPRGRATQSKISYKLTIDGQDISFIPNEPFNAKECLSEGDKSTIALSFFLSKLDIDSNRQNKILIFDDPLSSLDTNRRTYTIGLIRALFNDLKQIVVLSHNEYFLHEIGKDINASNKCTLRITEDFVAKASRIELCDLNELVKIDYFKHIEKLEEFRRNPDINLKDSVLGWLRNVLESHLRFKFYKEIRSMSSQQTFGRLISFLNNYPVTFRDNANRSDIILKLNLINGVSWKPHHGDPNPDYTTLGMNPNTITVSELDNLIQDTLSLIESRL